MGPLFECTCPIDPINMSMFVACGPLRLDYGGLRPISEGLVAISFSIS